MRRFLDKNGSETTAAWYAAVTLTGQIVRYTSAMTAFWIALWLVFAAELGDKTQLVALAFATRYKAWTVLAGVAAATLLVHLVSVGLGEAAGLFLPVWVVNVVSGLAFIGFGIWTLKGDTLDDDKESEGRFAKFGPFMTVAITFFLAELGDKTMLATITIASQQKSALAVWLGSSIGMVISDGLAIWVGKVLGKNLPERAIKYGAAAVFIITGIVTLVLVKR
jgi:putative Ca2+/H+ antiporter (TMEM165/GDT1 family)